MDICKDRIEKLKVIKVSSSCIIVENPYNQKGSVFISEVSDSYVVNLELLYKKGDVIYGYLVKEKNSRRYYSLKVGHTSNSKYVNEVGGGNLGLLYMINKFEKNHEEETEN